jgi:hypothetical protein
MQDARAVDSPPVSSFQTAARAMIPRMTSAGSHRVSVVIDRSRFPTLFSFVEWGIDMQLADVRDMLRLPMPEVGLESGHKFAATASLVNLIAGASVWFTTLPRPGCLIGTIVVAATARRLPPIGRGMTARSSR